ncbi:MAG: MarR family transcriptional regulator [Candidatus Omnitrophota bacterium]|jgi:DNA-binding MarR family transcriptional regulator|nr:MAG: MarR family transcriptional regulator [Candidatus Omnitrophota bacterium]
MPDISINEFADKITKIMPVLVREFSRHSSDELMKGKVSLPQFLIMCYLNEDKEAKMKDLAAYIHVTTAATTGIVQRLVREGYALRVYEPNDRRIIKIRLTDKGRELVKKISEQRKRAVIRVFGKISGSDRGQYLKILEKIKSAVLKDTS